MDTTSACQSADRMVNMIDNTVRGVVGVGEGERGRLTKAACGDETGSAARVR